MDLEARLARWEQRQENMIAGLHGILDGLEAMRGQLAEVVAWLQQPPSDELPALIQAMIATSEATLAQLARLDDRMAALPENVARAVTTAAR